MPRKDVDAASPSSETLAATDVRVPIAAGREMARGGYFSGCELGCLKEGGLVSCILLVVLAYSSLLVLHGVG